MIFKNKKNTIKKSIFITIFSILLVVFAIGTAFAVSQLKITKEKEIEIQDKYLTFELKNGTIQNVSTHKLIPLNYVNFNTDKYSHLLHFNDEAIVNKNGMQINNKLYINLKTHVEADFDLNLILHEVSVNNNKINGKTNSELTFKNDVASLFFNYKIQLSDLPDLSKLSKVKIVSDYEVVDTNGNSFATGTKVININEMDR